MKSSHRAQLAGITSMVTGAILAGDAQVTIEICDPEVYALARDFATAAVGGEQDGITQVDGRDLLLWTVEPTKERGPVRISLVWAHGRKAGKPGDDVVDLAAIRLLRDLKASLEPCTVCQLPLMQHTPNQRKACDAVARNLTTDPTKQGA